MKNENWIASYFYVTNNIYEPRTHKTNGNTPKFIHSMIKSRNEYEDLTKLEQWLSFARFS